MDRSAETRRLERVAQDVLGEMFEAGFGFCDPHQLGRRDALGTA
jgi:hypothetical protein